MYFNCFIFLLLMRGLAAITGQILIRYFKNDKGRNLYTAEMPALLFFGQNISIAVDDPENQYTKIQCHFIANPRNIFVDSILTQEQTHRFVSKVFEIDIKMTESRHWQCYVYNNLNQTNAIDINLHITTGISYINCSMYISQGKLVHDTDVLMYRNHPFTIYVAVEPGVMKRVMNLTRITCSKDGRPYIVVNETLTRFKANNGKYYETSAISAADNMEGTWKCTISSGMNSNVPLKLTFSVKFEDFPVTVSITKHVNNSTERNKLGSNQLPETDDSQRSEHVSATGQTNVNIDRNEDNSAQSPARIETHQNEKAICNSNNYTIPEAAPDSKVLIASIFASMIVTALIMGIIFTIYLKKYYQSDKSESLASHYEPIIYSSSEPGADATVDISKRAQLPIPQEGEENEKYIHYDTPYDHRFDRRVTNRQNKNSRLQ